MTRIVVLMLTVLTVLMSSGCATHQYQRTPAASGFSPLYMAVINNNAAQVKHLLDTGTDVNGRTMADFTALRGAAQLNRMEIAKLLVTRGADVNSLAVDNSTPLMAAAQFGHPEMARFLIANGANTSVRNAAGQVAVNLASGPNRDELVGIIESGKGDNSPQKTAVAVKKKKAEPVAKKTVDLKTLLAKNDTKGVHAYLDKHPEALEEIEDPHQRLLYTGPPKLRVINIQQLVKNKKKDSIIIAKINKTAGLYKDFNDEEMADLQSMGISDEVVAAMIASSNEHNSRSQEAPAAPVPLQRVTAAVAPPPQPQQVAQQEEPQSNIAAECLKLAAALKVCDQAGGFLSMGCKGIARSQFNCPHL